jgi:hypothetical protein
VIGDRWGVTQAEVARRYPCDELIRAPSLSAWRGVSVNAPTQAVWPWVTQIRLAPYSYDWFDNLGRRSPQQLQDLTEPVVGEPFTTAFRGRRAGRILSVEPGHQLTATIMGALMSYVLVSEFNGTRLLLKVVGRPSQALAPLLCVGDLVMARRQLLNLARLAERSWQDSRDA